MQELGDGFGAVVLAEEPAVSLGADRVRAVCQQERCDLELAMAIATCSGD